ncbi:MAG TPA: DUF948 domain-containing protein [Bryobacteraceae bacterium]|nr:DUF948 domain-containing protein [Bryobacteraceae bacterium]
MEPLLVVLTVFVAVAAIALCIQAGLLVGIYKATRGLQEQATSMMPQVRSILSKAETTIDESRRNVVEITAKANEITAKANEMAAKANDLLDMGKQQMVKLDSVVTDATTRARSQVERAEMVIDDTMTRVHQTVTAVHGGVLRPVREIQAVTAGVSAALQTLMRGGRPSVAQATHDDEMFI